jgi:GT2 family glycosyltransferase
MNRRQGDPLVYVIVLNWNGWRDTVDCLTSLQKLDYSNCEIVVVDNASTDGSSGKIREAYPDVTLLRTETNLGFAGGNNRGIEHALERGAEYIWILNNDTVVDPKALAALVEEMVSDRSTGMVGSKVYYHEPHDLIWFAGGEIGGLTAKTRHVGMGESDDETWSVARDVDYASGCSLLVSEQVLQSVGLMDTRFFLYFEETDWAARAREKGWRVRFQPSSRVWHKVSRSAKLDSPGMIFHFCKSGMLYARKHTPFRLPLVVLVLVRHHVLPFVARGNFRTAAAGIRGIKAGVMQKW